MTLTDFLLQRIAEDEAVAHAAERAGYPGPLRLMARGPFLPARVLAECEAKRAIVERLHTYAASGDLDSYTGYDATLVDILRILALPYADHPDYRVEWRP